MGNGLTGTLAQAPALAVGDCVRIVKSNCGRMRAGCCGEIGRVGELDATPEFPVMVRFTKGFNGRCWPVDSMFCFFHRKDLEKVESRWRFM